MQDPSTSASSTETRPRLRKIKHALIAVVLALGLIAVVGYLWLSATSDVSAVGSSECTSVRATGQEDAATVENRDAVCALFDATNEAWDGMDAEAYGDLFTEDATYVSITGTVYQGRRDITEGHEALFGSFLEGTKLDGPSILSMRFLGPDTATVTARGNAYSGDEPEELSDVQTYTLVREADGEWRIAAFQNTQRSPMMERITFILEPDTAPESEK